MRAALARWLRSASMWSTLAGLIVFLCVAWYFPQALANYRMHQLVVEFAVAVFLALTCAAIVAALTTALWLVAGGLRPRQTRARTLLDALETALVVFAILGVISVADVQWLRGLNGLFIPGWVWISLVIALFVLVCIFLAREFGSPAPLETTSRRLAAPARRSFLALWLVSAGITLLGGVRWRSLDAISVNPNHRAAGQTRPNFILITFDALSAEDMSLYGYRHHTTPNMDRLAARSIVFDRYYSAASFTSSAVTSILTGKNVFRHGWYVALSGRMANDKQQESLGTVLKANGYTTAAIVTNVAAHPMNLGLEDGFDVLPSPALPKIPGSDFAYHLTHTGIGRTVEGIGNRFMRWAGNTGLVPRSVTPYAPDVAFEQAEAFLSKVKGPYFLWVHLVPPHFPYDAPAPFAGHFLAGPAYRSVDMYAGTAFGSTQGDYDPRLQSEMDKIRLRYDEYVAYVDHEFGAFHTRLEQLTSGEDTVTMVSADHGENFNHGYWGHGAATLFNSSIHIPLIINLPGGKAAGTRVSGVAGEVDLLPTVLDLAGIAAPSWAEGRTLRPMWEGIETNSRTHIAINVIGGLDRAIARGAIAIVSWPDKYILDIESGRGNLFDLAKDPDESQDLSGEHPDRASEMRRIAIDHLSRARRHEPI